MSPPAHALPGPGSRGGRPAAGPVTAKWAVYLAAFVLVGGVFYALIVSPAKGARRPVYLTVGLAAVALLIAGAAELFAQAAQIGGLSAVGDALDTAWGARWWQRELAAAVAGAAIVGACALRRSGRTGLARGAEALALAAGLGCLLLLAAISHAASVDGSFWAVAADFIHLAAAALWAGMLLQLILVIRRSRSLHDEERAALAAAHLGRFSAVAAGVVLVLLATGIFSAFVQVDSLGGLVDTGYGVTLLAKLALLAPLLAIAAVNAVVLGPAVIAAAGRAGEEAGRALRRLGRLATVELAMIAAVIMVAAVLLQFPTAREEAESAAGAEAVIGYEEAQPAGDLSVNVSIAPNVVGTNSFQVFIFPPVGEELSDILRVRLRFQAARPQLGPVGGDRGARGAELLPRRGSLLHPARRLGGRGRPAPPRRGRRLGLLRGTGGRRGEGGDRQHGAALDGGKLVGRGRVRRAAHRARGVARRKPVAGASRAGAWDAAGGAVGGGDARGGSHRPCAAMGLLEFGDRPIGRESDRADRGFDWGGAGSSTSESARRATATTDTATARQSSGLPIPPSDFRIHIPFHSDRFFFLVMSNGFGSAMPGFGDRLSEEDRWNVLNYLQSRYGIEEADGDG